MLQPEEYEELVQTLREDLSNNEHQLSKMGNELADKEEELNELRQDYRDADEEREVLQREVNSLKSQLNHKEARITALQRRSVSEAHQETLVENQKLKTRMDKMIREHQKQVAKLEQAALEKEGELKRGLLHRQASQEALGVEDMQAAVESLVEQYESELATLREMNDSTIRELETRLDEAILDKEEIADGYLIEIERLELALNEAVTQLSEIPGDQAKVLKSTGMSSSRLGLGQKPARAAQPRRRYRSLGQKVLIKNGKDQKIAELPPHTEVVISEIFTHKKQSVKSARIDKGLIAEPLEYRGWVQLQTYEGRRLLEAIHEQKDTSPAPKRNPNTKQREQRSQKRPLNRTPSGRDILL